jgi:hypothetical protein
MMPACCSVLATSDTLLRRAPEQVEHHHVVLPI